MVRGPTCRPDRQRGSRRNAVHFGRGQSPPCGHSPRGRKETRRSDWFEGDWLPGGIRGLREHTHAKGMLFGLWHEAEAPPNVLLVSAIA